MDLDLHLAAILLLENSNLAKRGGAIIIIMAVGQWNSSKLNLKYN